MQPFRMVTPARLAVVAAVLLVAGLAGCSTDDDKPDAGATTTTVTDGDPSGSEGGELVVVAADFSLTDLTVGPGAEFTLDNQGDATHTATADDGSFDSGRVDGGQQSGPVAAPNEPGQYAFHCEIHNGMKATLTVE